jgi:hypothetical protein
MARESVAVNAVSNRVDVVPVADEHLPALAEFYGRVWNPGATPEGVRASRAAAALTNVARPGEPPPTWLVLQNGEAIAHVTTIPIRLWYDGSERAAYWIKGLWVLPEVQRSSAGFLVLRAAAAALKDPSLALVHEPAAIRLFQALGYADLGGLPNRLRILRPSSLLARLGAIVPLLGRDTGWWRLAARAGRVAAPAVGPIVGAANGLWVWLRTGSLAGLTTTMSDAVDMDVVDELWRSAREHLGPAVARGGAAIARRYAAPDYKFVQVRHGDRLVGLGIVKRPNDRGDERLGGLRIATISDVLYRPDDPRVAMAILRGAERAARAFDADALLASASPAVMDAQVRRLGYLTVPANLHVLVKLPGWQGDKPNEFGDWWITRGDSEGDGTF